MKKQTILTIFLLSSFLYNCTNNINNSPNFEHSYAPIFTSTPTPSSVAPSAVVFNSIDKVNTNSSPSCVNNQVLTLNVYSNKDNDYNRQGTYNFLERYFETSKNEIPLENVEIAYDDKKAFTDKEGRVNLPEKKSYKITLNKSGYYPYETTLENSCLSYIGLSPLNPEELNAKKIDFKRYSVSPKENVSRYPEFFIKDQKTGFGYYIVKNKSDYSKLQALELNGNSIYKTNINELEKSIDEKKEMLVLFIESSNIFGLPPAPIDSVVESENNIILANHKGININVIPTETISPGPIGDNFQIKIQALSIPYTDKKLKFMISESRILEVN